jgi:hypothetical protein
MNFQKYFEGEITAEEYKNKISREILRREINLAQILEIVKFLDFPNTPALN